MTTHSTDAQNRTRLPIAVTMGDPAGVGLQIAALAWRHRAQLALPPFALFADVTAIRAHVANLGTAIPISEISSVEQAGDVFQHALPVISVALGAPLTLGQSDSDHAAAVIQSIEQAVDVVMTNKASAVVTNPITKASLTETGFPHPGHTEFLGSLAHRGLQPQAITTRPVMMLASDSFRVVPLTVHMPLRKVVESVTSELITTTVHTVDGALRRDFAIEKPRVAVSGLNPHAGEHGTLGAEERDLIVPTLEHLRAEGLQIAGPLPADTMFHASARDQYDAAICMYHDQALIPLKTVAFDRGVNITLGLPFVRTSPDHGSALDIVGTGDVSASSFIESLKCARMIAHNRAIFDARAPSSNQNERKI